MTLILWEERFSVGVEALDRDHIVIASLINHVDDAKSEGGDERVVATLLKVLIQQAHEHFAREEALFERHGFPDAARHAEAHRLLEDQLAELHADYERTHAATTSQEILELLNYWLVEHILKVDMRYRDFFVARGAS